MSDWIFHFRNLDNTETWFAVCHFGCGGPIHDDRSACWRKTVPNNPTGGHDSVYNPSNWVVGFNSWWTIIKDGLDLVDDVATFIASAGEDEEALIDAFQDSFNLAEDTVQGIVGDYFANHVNLADAVQQNRQQAAQAVGLTPEDITNLAVQMGLGETGWTFVAGSPCVGLIHDDNDQNDQSGWSILCNPHGSLRKEVGNVLTNHVFINNGQLVFCWSSDLWKGKGQPNLWYNY